jgi:methionine--tRNA ligase beta chain
MPVSFDEFRKLDLRVAEIIAVEKVKGSKKLLKIKIDLGGEQRQIAAGLAEFYQPDELVGGQIIVVANLEPRKLMGIESQAMLLAADNFGRPILLRPEERTATGARVY